MRRTYWILLGTTMLGSAALGFVLKEPVTEAVRNADVSLPMVAREAEAAASTDATGRPAELDPAIESLLSSKSLEADLATGIDGSALEAIRQTYSDQDYKPLWSAAEADRLTAAADDLDRHGLDVDEILQRDLDAVVKDRFDGTSAEQRAQADVTLSAAWVEMALSIGGAPLADPDMTPAERAEITRRLLANNLEKAGAGKVEESLRPFEPTDPEYADLQGALVRLIERDADGEPVPTGRTLKLGRADDRVPALRQRLYDEGFYEPAITAADIPPPFKDDSKSIEREEPVAVSLSTSRVYDDRMKRAVMAFQRAHGLKVDGIVGPNTLDVINQDRAAKIERLAKSLAKLRVAEPIVVSAQ